MRLFNKDIKVIDQRFKANKAHYFLQCLMGTAAVMIILLTIDTMFKEVMIASFGATAFSIFALPHIRTSRPRSVMGGYTIGIILGVVLNLMAGYLYTKQGFFVAYSIMGAVAVGLSLLMMTMTNTEHPPAAGLALGLVLQGFQVDSLLIIYVSVLILLIIKRILRGWLINYIEFIKVCRNFNSIFTDFCIKC